MCSLSKTVGLLLILLSICLFVRPAEAEHDVAVPFLLRRESKGGDTYELLLRSRFGS
jgi:hypothetical protein